MANKIKTFKDQNGDNILPRTVSTAVKMVSGNTLDVDIGNRTYTEQNVVTNGQSITASINELDVDLASHKAENTSHTDIREQINTLEAKIELQRNIFVGSSYPTQAEQDAMNNGDIWLVLVNDLPVTEGLKLHLDYENEVVTSEIDGNLYVSMWKDLSGNFRHFEQSIQSHQPKLTDKGILSDSTNHMLQCTSELGMLRNVQSATIMTVSETVTYSEGGWIFVVTTSSGSALALQRTVNSKYYTTGRRIQTDSAQDAISSQNAIAGERKIITSEFKWAESKFNQYVNSVLDGVKTPLQSTGNTENLDSEAGYVILNSQGIDRPTNMYITDVLVFVPALSDVDRIATEQYLANKRGITL